MTEVDTTASTVQVVLRNSMNEDEQTRIHYRRPKDCGIEEIREFDQQYECCYCKCDGIQAEYMIDLVKDNIRHPIYTRITHFAVCVECYSKATVSLRDYFSWAYEWMTRKKTS